MQGARVVIMFVQRVTQLAAKKKRNVQKDL